MISLIACSGSTLIGSMKMPCWIALQCPMASFKAVTSIVVVWTDEKYVGWSWNVGRDVKPNHDLLNIRFERIFDDRLRQLPDIFPDLFTIETPFKRTRWQRMKHAVSNRIDRARIKLSRWIEPY